jgi:hypothetical protein
MNVGGFSGDGCSASWRVRIMNTRKVVIPATLWALSLVGVGLLAQSPTGGGTFGAIISLGGGLKAQYQGHADSSEANGGKTTLRGNVTLWFPDAHLMLVADEVVIGQPTLDEELVAQGNVRLKFVKP